MLPAQNRKKRSPCAVDAQQMHRMVNIREVQRRASFSEPKAGRLDFLLDWIDLQGFRRKPMWTAASTQFG